MSLNAPNAVTLASAACALAGLSVLSTHDTWATVPAATAVVGVCVGLSLIFDRLDGMLARRLGLSSPMGERLDTLADLLAFGVLPACLLVRRSPTATTYVIAGVYALGAVWRLARYEPAELAVKGRWGECFRGFPTPAGAAGVVVAVGVVDTFALPHAVELTGALAMAALMPSSVAYPKRGIGAVPWAVLVPVSVVSMLVRAFGV